MKYKYEFLYDSRQDYLWDEYQDYIAQKPMTPYERRLVRNWVKEGNSVYGCTQSRYYGESAYPMEFLEVYRTDRTIDKELQGKTPQEREAYLKDLLGYQEEPAEEKELRKAKAATPEPVNAHIRKLERELFHIWAFIIEKGLCSEAMEYVNEHKNEESPFEW
jgi:hypothetical protein